mmetsp:Transcript_1173/g.3040  ORF Transcript_1173/g.3040 Transcript_1173/m.3040 type:complete len:204 (-) Transcript_1173:681-1292(-)
MRTSARALFASASALAASLLALGCLAVVSFNSKRTALVSEFYGKGSITKDMFAGRCRCVGYNNPDPTHGVVCACTGKDDLWSAGPWMTVSGYAVAVDTSKPGGAQYLTIQGYGYPEGPKKPIHYYTLVRPWDDYGEPTMPDLFPDGHLGVPEDGFAMFETTAIKKYPSFRSRGIGKPGNTMLLPFHQARDVIKAQPALAPLFK